MTWSLLGEEMKWKMFIAADSRLHTVRKDNARANTASSYLQPNVTKWKEADWESDCLFFFNQQPRVVIDTGGHITNHPCTHGRFYYAGLTSFLWQKRKKNTTLRSQYNTRECENVSHFTDLTAGRLTLSHGRRITSHLPSPHQNRSPGMVCWMFPTSLKVQSQGMWTRGFMFLHLRTVYTSSLKQGLASKLLDLWCQTPLTSTLHLHNSTEGSTLGSFNCGNKQKTFWLKGDFYLRRSFIYFHIRGLSSSVLSWRIFWHSLLSVRINKSKMKQAPKCQLSVKVEPLPLSFFLFYNVSSIHQSRLNYIFTHTDSNYNEMPSQYQVC